MTSAPSKDVIDTMIAEAGGNLKGLHAVAAVINNRSTKRGLSPEAVVKEGGQFEGYSNPGRASRDAQKSAHVRALAEKAYNDIVSGKVADPTNGGTEFRAASSSGGLGKNVVNIGGNVFKLGNAPTTGLAAIQAAAPVPMPSLPAQARAYAPPPLPLARPAAPSGIRSIEINPDGTPKGSLADILAGRYGNSTARTAQGDTSIYNAVPGFAPSAEPVVSRVPSTASISLPRPRPDIPAPGLISRPVHTVAIDPLTGNPITSQQQLQQATNALAAKRASIQPPAFVSESHPLSNAVPAAPKNISYNSMAGTVALPPGVVPKSVQQDLPIVRSAQASNTPWFPFSAPLPPQVASAPVPMPGRPEALNQPPRTPDIIRSVPYVAPAQPKPNYTDTTSTLDIGPLGLTNNPFRAQPPAVQAITQATAPKTQTVLNPAYTAWQANPVAINKLQDIHDLRDNATMSAQTSRSPAPPKYITVPAPHVPVPSPTSRPLTSFNTVNPASQIIPRAGAYYNTTPAGHLTQLFTGQPIQGGLLGMLFGNSTPMAGLFGGGPAAPASPPPGANFLAERGVNTAGLNQSQVANELNKQLAGSSRNADGSRGFM